MRNIVLLGEDTGHETVLTVLLSRYSSDYKIVTTVKTLSSRGGLARVHHEFDTFLTDVDGDRASTPDLIVIATDSNCMGYLKRRQQLEKVALKYPRLKDLIAYAIPDPHIERWLMADPDGFKEVLGKGCTLPKMKCEKDEYKRLLDQSVRDAGVRPILGGLEYAEDLVNAANLLRIEKEEPSFEKTAKQIKAFFQQWQQ